MTDLAAACLLNRVMISFYRLAVFASWLMIAMTWSTQVNGASATANDGAYVEYSDDPATLLISFREIFPELAEQDPTPLVRIYGDGRVVVFHPFYMKQAGQYEMMLSRSELEDLILQLTPVLMDFDPLVVKKQKKALDDQLLASVSETNKVTLFHDADAEISVFRVNIDAYRPAGTTGQQVTAPDLELSWRGLRFDARDYLGIAPVQALMDAEITIRALTSRDELVRVDSPNG